MLSPAAGGVPSARSCDSDVQALTHDVPALVPVAALLTYQLGHRRLSWISRRFLEQRVDLCRGKADGGGERDQVWIVAVDNSGGVPELLDGLWGLGYDGFDGRLQALRVDRGARLRGRDARRNLSSLRRELRGDGVAPGAGNSVDVGPWIGEVMKRLL